MEQPNEGHADDYNNMCDLIEGVYGMLSGLFRLGQRKRA